MHFFDSIILLSVMKKNMRLYENIILCILENENHNRLRIHKCVIFKFCVKYNRKINLCA